MELMLLTDLFSPVAARLPRRFVAGLVRCRLYWPVQPQPINKPATDRGVDQYDNIRQSNWLFLVSPAR